MIGCMALYGTRKACQIVKATGMSRQYVAAQRDSVLEELRESLSGAAMPREEPTARDSKWNLTIRIDYNFVRTFVILAAMIFNASFASICQFFTLLFNCVLSETRARRIIDEASENCRRFNESVNYGAVSQVASDEIFQNGEPVLACVCLESGAVVGIRVAEDRTAMQWNEFFTDLRDRQGLDPDVNVSDAGTGLRAGLGLAFPDTEYQMDSMHFLQNITQTKTSLERKAVSLISTVADIEYAVDSGRRVWDRTIEKYLSMEPEVNRLIHQYDDFATLFGWLRELLDFGGYCYGDAMELAEWILDEMASVEPSSKKLTGQVNKMRRLLPGALAHLRRFEFSMSEYATRHGLSPSLLWAMYSMRSLVQGSEAHSRAYYAAGELAGDDSTFMDAVRALDELMHNTKRASSWIESLNSRLRKYMDIKRYVSDSFFCIVQTFINTMPCHRTRIEEWKGTSPLERLLKKNPPSFIDIALGDWKGEVA